MDKMSELNDLKERHRRKGVVTLQDLSETIQLAKSFGIPKKVIKTGMKIIQMLSETDLTIQEHILVLDILLRTFKGLEERRG